MSLIEKAAQALEMHARQLQRQSDVEPAARKIRRLFKVRWAEQERSILQYNRLNEIAAKEAITDWDTEEERKKRAAAMLALLMLAGPTRTLMMGTVSDLELEAYNRAVAQALIAGAQRAAEDVPIATVMSQLQQFEERWLRTRGLDRLAIEVDRVSIERLRNALADDYVAGKTYEQMARTIRATFRNFREERADLIAETELNDAFNHGNLEYSIMRGMSEKAWNPLGSNVCPICLANAAQGYIPIQQPFSSGHMAPLAHPRCLVGGSVVTAFGVAAQTSRWYEGLVCTLILPGGEKLTVTPNHPILTRSGWVPAWGLQAGDEVLQCLLPPDLTAESNVNAHGDYIETAVDEIGNLLAVSERAASRRMKVAAQAFHGDAIPNQEVDIVFANSDLAARSIGQLSEDEGFRCSECGRIGFPVLGPREQEIIRLALSPDGGMSGGGVARALFGSVAGVSGEHHGTTEAGTHLSVGGGSLGFPLGRAQFGSPEKVGLAGSAQMQTQGFPLSLKRAIADSGSSMDGPESLSCRVIPVQLVEVNYDRFSGQVFNLETASGLYLASSIVTHNCLCVADYR